MYIYERAQVWNDLSEILLRLVCYSPHEKSFLPEVNRLLNKHAFSLKIRL